LPKIGDPGAAPELLVGLKVTGRQRELPLLVQGGPVTTPIGHAFESPRPGGKSALIINHGFAVSQRVALLLGPLGFNVTEASTQAEALTMAANRSFDVAVNAVFQRVVKRALGAGTRAVRPRP
jgi:hypothetical protein